MALSTDDLDHLGRVWLGELRRSWARRYGTERGDCPVPAWEAMMQPDRVIIMRSLAAVVFEARPEALAKAAERRAAGLAAALAFPPDSP